MSSAIVFNGATSSRVCKIAGLIAFIILHLSYIILAMYLRILCVNLILLSLFENSSLKTLNARELKTTRKHFLQLCLGTKKSVEHVGVKSWTRIPKMTDTETKDFVRRNKTGDICNGSVKNLLQYARSSREKLFMDEDGLLLKAHLSSEDAQSRRRTKRSSASERDVHVETNGLVSRTTITQSRGLVKKECLGLDKKKYVFNHVQNAHVQIHARAKSHPGICSPLTHSIVSNDFFSGQRRS